MSNRAVLILVLAAGAILAQAVPASAQQTLNFHFGYFVPRGEDARVDDDILVSDRTFLAFDLKDFNGATIGAEWLIPIGNYVEAGAGLGFYRRTVGSVYTNFTHQDNSEIEQDLRLRIIPIALTMRVLPLGQSSAVQPYFGAGLGVLAWRYSETGEFVDFSQGGAITRGAFVGSGTATGPVALGGIRFAGDSVSAGFEARYQSGSADLGSEFNAPGFTPAIDLGGWTYQATVGIRFGR
jgi:hypothetical protein